MEPLLNNIPMFYELMNPWFVTSTIKQTSSSSYQRVKSNCRTTKNLFNCHTRMSQLLTTLTMHKNRSAIFTVDLYSGKVLSVNQSERALWQNFIMITIGSCCSKHHRVIVHAEGYEMYSSVHKYENEEAFRSNLTCQIYSIWRVLA